MTEAARPLDQDQASLDASWDMSALPQSLDVADVAHGQGVAVRLGPGPGTLLELFPQTRTVRLTGQDLQLTLFRQDPPRLADEGLVFELAAESRRRWVSVSPTTGEVMLFYDPAAGDTVCGPETAQDASETAERPNPLPRPKSPVSADLVPPEHPSRPPFQTGLPQPETAQTRVSFTGRLGRDPGTKETRSGKFVMEFPVAVKVEGQEKPDWRDVVVFDARARKLLEAGTLARGVAVDVVAYERSKPPRQAKDGSVRIDREYYATAVVPRPKGRGAPEADA